MSFQIVKPVYAEVCNTLLDPNCSTNPDPITSTQNVIQAAFGWFMVIAVIFLIYHIINGGLRLVTSQGDAKKVEEGRQSITYAIIGAVIVFSIFAVLKLLGMVFGIDNLSTLQLTLPSLSL